MKYLIALAALTASTLGSSAYAHQNVPALNSTGLAALGSCESGNNHQIDTGNGYYGAYQFDRTTWNAASTWAGYGEYAGVNPAHVPGWVQDQVTVWLWNNDPERIGHDRWPVCQHVAIKAMNRVGETAVTVPVFTG